MNPLIVLDWMAGFVLQMAAQVQCWLLLAVLVGLFLVFMGIGAVLLQLTESLDRNDVGPILPH